MQTRSGCFSKCSWRKQKQLFRRLSLPISYPIFGSATFDSLPGDENLDHPTDILHLGPRRGIRPGIDPRDCPQKDTICVGAVVIECRGHTKASIGKGMGGS